MFATFFSASNYPDPFASSLQRSYLIVGHDFVLSVDVRIGMLQVAVSSGKYSRRCLQLVATLMVLTMPCNLCIASSSKDFAQFPIPHLPPLATA